MVCDWIKLCLCLTSAVQEQNKTTIFFFFNFTNSDNVLKAKQANEFPGEI